MDRDNQQATCSEIAWLAGLMEGEGSISMTVAKNSQGDKPKLSFGIMLYNTDALIIKKAVEIMRLMGFEPNIIEKTQKPMMKADGSGHYFSRDPMLVVRIRTMTDILSFLTKLRPYLFGQKSARADLIMQLIKRRLDARSKAIGNSPRHNPVTEEDYELIRRYCELPGTRTKALQRVLND